MQKRSDNKRQEKQETKILAIKKILIFMIFILFTGTAIYAVDTSTNKIMNSKEDKSALGIYLSVDKSLHIDIAGEKYNLKADGLINIINSIGEGITNLKTKINYIFYR